MPKSFTRFRTAALPNDSFLAASHPWERLQDVSSIRAKVLAALKELTTAYSDITAIGLTGQMHGIVYLDKDGNPVSPLYTWQDGRGNLPDYEEAHSIGIPCW